jgi:hypothetical protein
MATLLMAGHDRTHVPTRALREAARTSSDPMARRVSTGRVQPWDLFSLRASALPGAADWADKALDGLLAGATERYKDALDCTDCVDVGFYGLTSREDPDVLTSLVRRVDDQGYEVLTAAAGWQPYEVVADEYLEVLSRELAGDLAEAVTAGAAGMVRRYFWPLAFLPPGTMLAAAPAPELDPAAPSTDAPTAGQQALDEQTAHAQGWREYAVVDDMDPGAVLDLIRLRRGPDGPELVAYRNQAWTEAPEILSDLQGVQPPPLVELSADQLANVLTQIDGDDSAGPKQDGESTPADDAAGAAAVAASLGLTAASTSLPEGGFPIASRSDLKKAVQAFGRATNKTAAKRHIIKRARALSAVSLLPKSWGVTASANQGKQLGALLADAPLTVSPDPRAEKLRRYWTTGKGALKIRWGTPGDWTRCYRQLRKFMGLRAKGYCQNLHKRSTGQWTGSRLNAGGQPGRPALAASGTSGALSMEAALVAAVSTGRWFCPEGGNTMLKDGIYAEGGANTGLLRTLTAGGFPVAPPDDWFENPELDGPTPLTVDDDGRVYGHIATRDVAHIGLPGRVHAPKSRSNYAYFKTGQLVTASGKKLNVGQLTLSGGHAPLSADAASAVAHYDNTASAVADLNIGDDRHGIWVAGALRPEVTPDKLRALRASAPSGDWRPINGQLELVACCQVNVPGFPVVRARVASGAITSLVAAGAPALYARRIALMADAAVAERVTALEAAVFAQLTEGLEDPSDVIVADGDLVAEVGDGEPLSAEEVAAEGLEETPEEAPEEKPVSDAVKRAREAVAARKAAQEPEAVETPAESPQEVPAAETETEDPEKAKADRLAALRERVHPKAEPVAASAGK